MIKYNMYIRRRESVFVLDIKLGKQENIPLHCNNAICVLEYEMSLYNPPEKKLLLISSKHENNREMRQCNFFCQMGNGLILI